MRDNEHIKILQEGAENWNRWRYTNKAVVPNLRGAKLAGQHLNGINLQKADLRGANLSKTILSDADLREANLQEAKLHDTNLMSARLNRANLIGADLRNAVLSNASLANVNLSRATLSGASLYEANLRNANLHKSNLSDANLDYADLGDAELEGANLTNASLMDVNLTYASCKGANFSHAKLAGAKLHWADLSNSIVTDATLVMASLIETNLENADLSNSWIYGISVWNPNLKGAVQRNLVITSRHIDASEITVDNVEIAQFIYLLIRSEKMREVIDTIGKKAVLILGRFMQNRKVVLDAVREELRRRNYIPILFDFDKPDSRDLTETVVILAHLSRFVIADLTEPGSIPHELMAFVDNLPSVAVQPIVNKGHQPYAMFEHLQRYSWVLPVYEYETQEQLIAELTEKIINPVEAKVLEIHPGV